MDQDTVLQCSSGNVRKSIRYRVDLAEHKMNALQVAGTVAADTLKIGNITVKNQGFGLVLSSSRDFLDISCDGLFVSSCTCSVNASR